MTAQSKVNMQHKGTFFPDSTCQAGLSLLLDVFGASERECRGDQPFFATVSHESRFVRRASLSW